MARASLALRVRESIFLHSATSSVAPWAAGSYVFLQAEIRRAQMLVTAPPITASGAGRPSRRERSAALEGRRPLAPRRASGARRVLGMGGAVTNICAVDLGLKTFYLVAVQGATLDVAEIERQIELYRTRSADERLAIVGLQPARAEIILAGAVSCARRSRSSAGRSSPSATAACATACAPRASTRMPQATST